LAHFSQSQDQVKHLVPSLETICRRTDVRDGATRKPHDRSAIANSAAQLDGLPPPASTAIVPGEFGGDLVKRGG
jgi:hypothetical protein